MNHNVDPTDLTHRLVSHVLDHALHHRRLALDERDVPAGRGVVKVGPPPATAPPRGGGAALAPPVAADPRVVISVLVLRSRMPTASCNREDGIGKFPVLVCTHVIVRELVPQLKLM